MSWLVTGRCKLSPVAAAVKKTSVAVVTLIGSSSVSFLETPAGLMDERGRFLSPFVVLLVGQRTRE